MSKAIGIRLPKDLLEKVDKLGKAESNDRSTTLRKLVVLGLSDLSKRTAAEEYIKGKITLSQAAQQAGLTLFDMERYLVENGFKSAYSTEDLEKELQLLR